MIGCGFKEVLFIKVQINGLVFTRMENHHLYYFAIQTSYLFKYIFYKCCTDEMYKFFLKIH